MGGHVLGIGTYRDVATHNYKSCLYTKKDAPAFALLKTCSQINAEAATLAYSLNTFSFLGDDSVVAFTAFASTRGIQAIRVIRISYDHVFFRRPTDLLSQLIHFRSLEEIKINFAGEKLDSAEYNHACLRKFCKLLRNYKPGVRVMMWDPFVGLSSVKYH